MGVGVTVGVGTGVAEGDGVAVAVGGSGEEVGVPVGGAGKQATSKIPNSAIGVRPSRRIIYPLGNNGLQQRPGGGSRPAYLVNSGQNRSSFQGSALLL